MTKLPADKAFSAKSKDDLLRESPPDSAERKRLAARRRFLVGGAAAVPVVLTFGPRQAHAMGGSVCISMGGTFPGGGGGVPSEVPCVLFPNP